MDILRIVIMLTVAVVISFIAIHFWVFICDCFIGGLKKIFHIGKKKKINWHTLDDKNENVDKEDINNTIDEIWDEKL